MAKDEEQSKDLTEDFGDAIKKDTKLTKLQTNKWVPHPTSATTKETWERIRKNIREIRKQRRRKRRR